MPSEFRRWVNAVDRRCHELAKEGVEVPCAPLFQAESQLKAPRRWDRCLETMNYSISGASRAPTQEPLWKAGNHDCGSVEDLGWSRDETQVDAKTPATTDESRATWIKHGSGR